MQTAARTVDIKIAVNRTRFTARSAEALVDGFIAGDFAVVTVRRVPPGEVLRANRVLYDVVPFGPITQFTLTGAFVREAVDGHAFLMHLKTGTWHWISVNANTQYTEDGSPIAMLPDVRGEILTVSIHRLNGRWIALSVDVKTA